MAADDYKREVPDLGAEHNFDEEPSVEGIYQGSRIVKIGNRDAVIHDLMTEEGIVSVWGATVLDRKLTGLVGHEVYIEFTGVAEEFKKGQDPAKLYRVLWN